MTCSIVPGVGLPIGRNDLFPCVGELDRVGPRKTRPCSHDCVAYLDVVIHLGDERMRGLTCKSVVEQDGCSKHSYYSGNMLLCSVIASSLTIPDNDLTLSQRAATIELSGRSTIAA